MRYYTSVNRALALALSALALSALAPPGFARADEAEGRRLLEEAAAAREDGRLLDAERLLRASLAEHEWTYPAFLLGTVLAEMGRPRDALVVLEALEEGRYGEVEGRAARELATALDEARARVSVLEVRWERAGPTIVRVDGELVFDAEGTAADVPVNPGRRIVTAERVGFPTIERVVDAAPGARVAVALAFDAAAEGQAEYRFTADADVLIVGDGLGRGVGLLAGRATPGRYAITWSVDGERRARDVDLSPDARLSLRLERPTGGDDGWLVALGIGLGVLAAGAAAALIGFAVADGQSVPIDPTGT